MRYKCFLNNDYEVISHCDTEEFNEKIRKFKDKSWNQIIIQKKLTIPSNKPPLKNITRIFLSVKLISNKIIKTPLSDVPNIEGTTLTGKLLLVSGIICENIVYISDTVRNSIHSAQFKTPFNTYIVIDKETDLKNDYFHVYPCIQDIFIIPLNQRNLSKSLNLFLFAHRIIPLIPLEPPIVKLSNTFVFTNLNNEEMVKVEFNTTDKKLIAKSTGNNYGGGGLGTAFTLQLKDSTETEIKASATINENENGDAFRDALNGVNYENNDKIVVFTKDDSKLVLTNFPEQGENYEVPNGEEQTFQITPDAITFDLLSNKIIVKSKNGEEVLNIQFNKGNETFIVSHTGVVPDPTSTEAYFTLMLKDNTGKNLLEVALNSNEDGSRFKNFLNDKPYDALTNKLILLYKNRNKIEISNYPKEGNTYIPNSELNIFKIENDGLIDDLLPNKIKILGDKNQEICGLRFSKGVSGIIIPKLTGDIGTNTISETTPYVEFLNYQDNGFNIFTQILGKKNASDFVSKFEDKVIASETPIRLFNKIPNRIIITDYKNEDEYQIGEEPEFFKSNGDNFVPHNLNYNKIRLKNQNNSSVVYIYFDKLASNDIYIEPYSTGKINLDTDNFTFKIMDPNETITKVQGSFKKGETADSIYVPQAQNEPNISKNFNIGDVLILEYSDKSLVEIFDFPFIKNPYNPVDSSYQKFLITKDGLKPMGLSANIITFKGYQDKEITTVKFDDSRKKLIVESTGNTANITFGDKEYFAFVLKGSDGAIKAQASVKGNETADNFKNLLNEQNFQYGDIVIIRNKEADRIQISNFLKVGNTIEPFLEEDSFRITKNGLERQYNYLPTDISFKGFRNNLIAKIRFNKDLKKIQVGITGFKANHLFGDKEYFAFVVKSPNGTVKAEGSTKGNEIPNNFRNALNEQNFEYGDIIVMRSKEFDKIGVYDLTEINVFLGEDSFKITENGLENQYNYLPNIISFKGLGNNLIAQLRFNNDFKRLSVGSSAIMAHKGFGNNEYFAFVIKNAYGNIMKESSVKGNETADNFKDILNLIPFDFGYFITLRYKERDRVLISNFPKPNQTFKPPNQTKDFKITQNGLEDAIAPPPPEKLINIINIISNNGTLMVTIEFDITNKKLIAMFNDVKDDSEANTSVLCAFTLNSDKTELNFNTNPNNFTNTINNKSFNFGDTLRIDYFSNNHIRVANYPSQGSLYFVRANPLFEEFRVESSGIVKLT